MRVLRDELTRTSDRQRLLQFARRWLYEHRLIVLRERDLRMMIIKAIRQHEAGLARTIVEAVDPLLLAQWRATVTQPHESGTTVQSWLWAARRIECGSRKNGAAKPCGHRTRVRGRRKGIRADWV